MWFWPKLSLTEYEKKHVGYYKADNKPGVMRRVYTLQLANQAQSADNIPAVSTVAKYQIARRSRIFAITFTGNTDTWRLQVYNTNGTQYVNPAPRSQAFPIVSSIIAGSYYNVLARGGMPSPMFFPGESDSIGSNPDFSYQHSAKLASFPWIIEPNWVCQPNESIIFQGTDASVPWIVDGETPLTTTLPTVLNISIYAWEFPGMSS